MSVVDREKSFLLEVLGFLLTPVVRFAIRHSQTVQDFEQVLRVVFVRVAEEEMVKHTQKVNVSRLSVMTGLYREEVKRIFGNREAKPKEQASILSRVIGQWRHDKRFQTESGKPRVLRHKGDDSDFRILVESVTKAINPGTVAFELKRLGYVAETKNGLKLLSQFTGLAQQPREGYQLLSKDVDSLVGAVSENLEEANEISNLHIRTEYDNIDPKHIPSIRKWLWVEGKAFHKKVREYLSALDRDLTPPAEGEESSPKRTVVVVGAFGHLTELDQEAFEKINS